MMIRTLTLSAAALALSASLAAAALPPHVYDQARAGAANVIVIAVEAVETTGPLSCVVTGRVVQVERGSDYAPEQIVQIAMPCIGHVRANPPVGGAIYQRTPTLRESAYGRAYLDHRGGLALDQYQILATPEEPPRD